MIETESLIVRPFQAEDANDLYAYLSLPVVYLYEPGEPISIEQARHIARTRSRDRGFWAAELKEEAQVVGHVSFFQIDPPELAAWEIGYIFHPHYQRRGYATEATKAIVAYGFDELGAHRIVAHCNPENIASWSVLEKAGFRREGHFRKNMFFHRDENGTPQWIDTYEYAILESDSWDR